MCVPPYHEDPLHAQVSCILCQFSSGKSAQSDKWTVIIRLNSCPAQFASLLICRFMEIPGQSQHESSSALLYFGTGDWEKWGSKTKCWLLTVWLSLGFSLKVCARCCREWRGWVVESVSVWSLLQCKQVQLYPLISGSCQDNWVTCGVISWTQHAQLSVIDSEDHSESSCRAAPNLAVIEATSSGHVSLYCLLSSYE